MNNKIQPIIVCSACSHFIYRNSFLIIFWLSSKCKFNLLHTCTYIHTWTYMCLCMYAHIIINSEKPNFLWCAPQVHGCDCCCCCCCLVVKTTFLCVRVCVYLLKVKLFESVKLLITIINLVFAMYCPHITHVQYEKYYFHTHMNTSVCRPLSLFFWFRPIVCYHNLLLCHVVHTVFEWMYLKNVFTYRCMYMCVSRWQPCITRCFRC